jgi:hypothetical protein
MSDRDGIITRSGAARGLTKATDYFQIFNSRIAKYTTLQPGPEQERERQTQ